jgi:hypothetical protein
MKDLTRREFLNTAAGAAVSSTILGNAVYLHGEAIAATFLAGGNDVSVDRKANRSLQSLIFPEPREISASGTDFVLNEQVSIVIPSDAGEEDVRLARSLANELGDRFGLHLKTKRATALSPDERVILMGSMKNPLVRQYCTTMALIASTENLGAEGYIVRVDSKLVLVAGTDDRGAFYGLQSLRQLVAADDKDVRIHGVLVRDQPDKSYRGIYMFLPGRDNIAFFKRFVRDFMALYKYNTLILEMNACMRLDSHPELNYGWVQFARDANYSCRNYPPRPAHNMEQNSSHQDTADGGFLEKEEVADLASWARKHHIEVVPSLPSFTHSYYLLSEHRELAAVPQNKWPDIYCPTMSKSYDLVFEVYDEYLDVLKPKSVHIGHDELFLPVDVSPQCRDRDIGELFGEDVKRIHDHLASRGVKTQLWGDMLLQSVRGSGLQKKHAPDGWTYESPGGLTPEQVERLIPKDCLIYNWFWRDEKGQRGSAEQNEAQLDKMGFQQIFGNFEPGIENYEARKKRSTLLGGAPSGWAATNEAGFGKELMATFLGCSSILWTGHVSDGKTLSAQVQSMLPDIRIRLSGVTPPSRTETSIVPVDISSRFNSGAVIPPLSVSFDEMMTGSVRQTKVPFELKSVNSKRAIVVGTKGRDDIGLPESVAGIPVGEAPTSLIFLHAAARPALNRESFRLIWDQQDTADLLGWYEVAYEDGFVTTIPIRYGVNICEWNWDERNSANDYCYGADALAVGREVKDRVTFFAYEWINPRLGKVIWEIRLKGTTGFRGASGDFNNEYGAVIASNAVMLVALSIVQKRS